MVDYFSRLPESLIHRILSFLPFKEIVRTCVLSKDWNSIWCNYPILDFSLTNNEYPYPLWRWVENSLSQCLVRRPFIQELHLHIKFPDVNTLTRKLNHWLGLALDKNVSKLVLVTDNFSFAYPVPEQVLVSRTLEVLNLTWCALEEDRFACFELPRLEKLYLTGCRFIGDNLLQKIVHACPKMERIGIYQCYGVGRCQSISCNPLLKHFSFWRCKGVERIEINAPSLRTLSYASSNVACAVDVTNCTNLKELELIGDNLEQVLSLFHAGIQVLNFTTSDLSRKHKISSQSLEKLILNGLDNFPCVEIDAPNVHTLEVMALNSEQNFSCWNVPKVHTIYLSFAVDSFEPACRAGLEGFVMKLHNCKDLKFIISLHDYDILLIENLHCVSFSSIVKLIKKSGVSYVRISSRDETSFLANQLPYKPNRSDTTLYIICSSPGSIKSVHEKLSNHPSIQRVSRLLQLVTADEEVEIGMDGDLKSLMGPHSTGIYHNAKIILRKRN